MSDKHTQGPWHWVDAGGYHVLVGEQGTDKEFPSLSPHKVLDDGSACGEYNAEIDVNGPDARLIAAAPELLEALEATAKMYQNATGLPMPSQAYRAISKARGQ